MRETDEVIDAQRFRPRPRVEARGGDLRLAAEPAQRVAQRLAPLREARPDDVGEPVPARGVERDVRPGPEPHQRGLHPGRGRERAGADPQDPLRLAVELHHDAEPPVRAGAGRGHHALDDLALQHQVHVRDPGQYREEPEHERCRDVVGKVAGHPEPPRGRGDAREVELQRVRIVHGQVRVACRPLAERGGEIAIDLDGVQLAARFEQGQGEGAASGPDLHDQIVGPGRDRVDDAPHHGAVVEEVLPESPARPAARLTGG